MLTNSHALNQSNDSKSTLYYLHETSRRVLAVHAPLPGHAHHNAPADSPKACSELIGGGVPQGLGVQAQKYNGCQDLHITTQCVHTVPKATFHYLE